MGSWALDPLSLRLARRYLPDAAARRSLEEAEAWIRAHRPESEASFRRFVESSRGQTMSVEPGSITLTLVGGGVLRADLVDVAAEGRKVRVRAVADGRPATWLLRREGDVLTATDPGPPPLTHRYLRVA